MRFDAPFCACFYLKERIRQRRNKGGIVNYPRTERLTEYINIWLCTSFKPGEDCVYALVVRMYLFMQVYLGRLCFSDEFIIYSLGNRMCISYNLLHKCLNGKLDVQKEKTVRL